MSNRERFRDIKVALDREVELRESESRSELSYDKPDPLMVASKYRDEYISLICALFSYGKASSIVNFLDSLDFSLLDGEERKIERELQNSYYRFQNSQDVIAIFKAIRRIKQKNSIEDIVKRGYKKENSILDGLWELIEEIEEALSCGSRGYRFLIGKVPKKVIGASPFKRYMLYFRWMIRDGELDLNLWSGISKSDLIIPLDTHTFNVSKSLGLLKRERYDLKSAIELTDTLKEFDPTDPIKYDFAIYRLGQERAV
jgi:uncharacterized protein (TIGR02757 family)